MIIVAVTGYISTPKAENVCVSFVVSLFVKELEEQRNNYGCLLLHVQLFPGADVIPHYTCLSEPYDAFLFFTSEVPKGLTLPKIAYVCMFGFTFVQTDSQSLTRCGEFVS